MPRELPEWIGASPDTPVPDRVKVRVFERYGGFCHFSGQKIRAGDPWDVDHIQALINGGENIESNLAPILKDKHKEKTAQDVAEKSKTYQRRKKYLGIKSPSRSWGYGKNDKFKMKIGGGLVDRESGEPVNRRRT